MQVCRRYVCVVWCATMLFGAAVPAFPQATPSASQAQLKICLGKYLAPRDERLVACNAVAAAGEATPAVNSLIHTFNGDDARGHRSDVLALSEYEQAIRLDGQNFEAYCGRGDLRSIKGDYDRAISDFDEGLRLNPVSAQCLRGRALAYWHMGNNAQVISDMTMVIKLNPRDVDAFFNRAMALTANSELERAIADFDQVIRFSPADATAYYNRGLAKYKLGHFDEGSADIFRARGLDRQVGQ